MNVRLLLRDRNAHQHWKDGRRNPGVRLRCGVRPIFSMTEARLLWASSTTDQLPAFLSFCVKSLERDR